VKHQVKPSSLTQWEQRNENDKIKFDDLIFRKEQLDQRNKGNEEASALKLNELT
jgi:hypothetical protein